MLKWTVGFRHYFYPENNAKGYEKCRRVIWIISAMSNIRSGNARVHEDHLKECSVRPLLIQNLLKASKHPSDSLSSCCCSLLLRITVLRYFYGSFSR